MPHMTQQPVPGRPLMRYLFAVPIVFCILAAGFSACTAPDTTSLSLESVAVALENNTFAPRLSVDAEDRLLLSYLEDTEEGHALKFVRHDGREWTAPQTVTEGTDWFANWADTPGVRPVGDWLFAHWLVRSGPVAYHYSIHAAWSDDGGATWSDPFVLHGEERPAEHGFLSSVVLNDSTLGVAWLDGRRTVSEETNPNDEATHDSHTNSGAMSLRWARLKPGETRLSQDIELDARVCDCCMTASVREGTDVRILYRDRTQAEVRDIASARVTPAGHQNEGRVAADDWQMPACPVEGPAVARRGTTTDAVWFTGSESTPKVFWASARNDSGDFGAATQIDQGHPAGRVGAVAVDTDRTLLTWVEAADAGASSGHIMARLAHGEEASAASNLVPVTTGRGSGFPVLARTTNHVWLAWTAVSDDTRRVRIGRVAGVGQE